MRRHSGSLLALFLLLLFSSTAWSQAFQPLFNYQGRLTDANGDPLEGFVTLDFTIEERSVLGEFELWAPIWQSTRVDVPLNDGFFSVNLGEVEPLPTDLSGNQLKLILGAEGYPEFDTEFLMTWSPQAVTAMDAERLDGLDPSAYDQSRHLTDNNNPHAVTAAQTGALPETAVYDEVARLEQLIADAELLIADKADSEHQHDERYYSETEVDDLLAPLIARIDQLEQDLQALADTQPDPSFGGAIRRENDRIIFEGVNVAIRNGSGQTDSSNGLGNLVLGYNVPKANIDPAFARTGSHNLIIGDEHRYRSHSSVAVGRNSLVGSPYTVAIGSSHYVYGIGAIALGGAANAPDVDRSIVIGGGGNSAYGVNSIVVGGSSNSTDAAGGVIVGGRNNDVGGTSAIVVGGEGNRNDVPSSLIVGRSHQTTGGIQ